MKLSAALVFLTGILALASAILGVSALLAVIRHGRVGWFDRERMPYSLRKATLIMNETELYDANGGLMRVDQVFQLPSGEVVVVDTKTRDVHATLSTDHDQLLRYRKILREVYNYQLAPYAYIRTVVSADRESARKVKYIKVRFA